MGRGTVFVPGSDIRRGDMIEYEGEWHRVDDVVKCKPTNPNDPSLFVTLSDRNTRFVIRGDRVRAVIRRIAADVRQA